MSTATTSTDIKIEDEKDEELERALHKARKLKQKEKTVNQLLLNVNEMKSEPAEENADLGSIVLNSTAEFCRTLGWFLFRLKIFFLFF